MASKMTLKRSNINVQQKKTVVSKKELILSLIELNLTVAEAGGIFATLTLIMFHNSFYV